MERFTTIIESIMIIENRDSPVIYSAQNSAIEKPPEPPYTNQDNDPVRFQPITNGVVGRLVNQACYAGFLDRTNEKNNGFVCLKPNVRNRRFLDEETFFKWIALCKEYGLVIHDAVPYVEDGNQCMWLPEGFDYHAVYATLCCFRWTTHYMKMIDDIIVDFDGKCSFYQVLHYHMRKALYNTNHNFCNVGRSVYNCPNINLADSVAWYGFFMIQTALERKSLKSNTTIDAMYNFKVKNLPEMLLTKMEDILNPIYTPLYRVETLSGFRLAWKKCQKVC